jgi:hypothetical protein
MSLLTDLYRGSAFGLLSNGGLSAGLMHSTWSNDPTIRKLSRCWGETFVWWESHGQVSWASGAYQNRM